jgi:hypothetical protein
MDWTYLAQDRWRAPVNAVINLRVPQNTGNFFSSYLLAPQEGLCSVESVSYAISDLSNFKKSKRTGDLL